MRILKKSIQTQKKILFSNSKAYWPEKRRRAHNFLFYDNVSLIFVTKPKQKKPNQEWKQREHRKSLRKFVWELNAEKNEVCRKDTRYSYENRLETVNESDDKRDAAA